MPPGELDAYYAKRDPKHTPEPFGADRPLSSAHVFVVQQHGARSLHWDLRLEIGPTLVSWAVPKGPSTDPNEKRLAVRTEDHPLDYADFEGVIPADSYGAGPMILWDRGIFHSHESEALEASLQRGKLDLELFGHKLCGRWALVRLKRSDSGKDWLLIKKHDAFASKSEITQTHPHSIVSGLDLEQRRDGDVRARAMARAARDAGGTAADLEREALEPMLATSVDAPFSRDDWLYEIKYDGVRAVLAATGDGTRHLLSRRGRDYRLTFPEIALAARYLPAATFAVDGEIIAVEESGGGSFELLQQRLGGGPSGVRAIMYAFDLLHLGGCDLRHLPLTARKALLRAFLPQVGPLRYVDHLVGDGERFYAAAKARGLEGIVAKRADSTYRSGERSERWRKIKAPRTARLVVVGWTPGKRSRDLGSLLVAWHVGETLRYAGNVGSGLDTQTRARLLDTFSKSEVERPMFAAGELEIPRQARFVPPALVVEVRYTEVTSSGALRQPVFLAADPSGRWQQCTAPAAAARTSHQEAAAPASSGGFRRSNTDKIFWPADGYSKGDLLDYYEAAWPFLRIYLRDRPLVLTRYPDGIGGKSFFQKNAPEFTPTWVDTQRIGDTDYIVANRIETLLYVTNLGCIPLHLWSARCASIDEADWCVLDLDPKGAPFTAVVGVARHLHQMLADFAVPHFVKTSGQAGLHVMVPLAAGIRHGQAKTFAEIIARIAARELPDTATIARPLRERGDRVYIDFLQNGEGKTIASPLCVRPVDGALVSMPLRWSQVTKRLDPARFHIRSVAKVLDREGDPMAPLMSGDDRLDSRDLATVLERARGRLAAQ